jgi:hypothetical protein
MRTWVFQANPDAFDVDGYLAMRPAEFPWLVTRYADDIAVGDRVYLWRTQGKHKVDAGVIAEAEVIGPTALRPESPDAVQFWRAGADEGAALLTRAMLRPVRIAGRGEVIQRAWCIEDPILRDLPNLQMAAATNYPLSQTKAGEIAAALTALRARDAELSSLRRGQRPELVTTSDDRLCCPREPPTTIASRSHIPHTVSAASAAEGASLIR